MGNDIQLCQDCGLLKITVGDVARQVVLAHQLLLHVTGERVSPIVAVAQMVKEHASHTSTSSISGANDGRGLRDELGKVSGARAQASGKTTKGIKVAANEGS